MKNIKLFLIISLITLMGVATKAQKIDIVLGDKKLSFLNGMSEFNLKFEYNGMLVGDKPEDDYLKNKTYAYNKKEPGKGDQWAQNWVNSRQEIYEPLFEKTLAKRLVKGNIKTEAKVTSGSSAKYTIQVKTLVTEPGYIAFKAKGTPYCTFEISWIDNSTGAIMAKGILDKVEGELIDDSGYNIPDRIKEAYKKAALIVGATMVKAINADK